MTAIPFGMIGAVLDHLLLGYNLSIVSFFGIVALAGVLVNDSLVLLDAINKQVVSGAESQLSAVLLASITTFGGGLLPMITETSIRAPFLIPMAISLGFGVLFTTGITLLLIPALYMMITKENKGG